MENLVTPSERAQSLINPHIRSHSEDSSPQEKVILGLKIMLGTPIPILLILYVCGLVVSEKFLSLVALATCTLTLLYIFVDRFSQHREFRFFFNVGDLPMVGFFLVGIIGSFIHWPGLEADASPLTFTWILAYFLISYGLFLFPGLNRLFKAFAIFVPLACLFVIWQKFFGLRVNLSQLPDGLAHAVAGIDTVGLFEGAAPFAYAVGTFISFATAALFVKSTRYRSFKTVTLLTLAIAWLSLVTLHSTAVFVAVMAAVLGILLYCHRASFFLLAILTALFVFVAPDDWTFYQSFSPWMERGEHITEEKRDVSKAELQMFQDSIWFGVGYGQHQTLLPEYFHKLNIERQESRMSSNNYFTILASTGIIGFALFTLITAAFFLRTHRLWLEIPRTHYWHRTFVMGCLGSQIVFHVLGLYQSMMLSLATLLILALFLAIINYMNESYSRGIIPDDYSL